MDPKTDGSKVFQHLLGVRGRMDMPDNPAIKNRAQALVDRLGKDGVGALAEYRKGSPQNRKTGERGG